jgi:N-methylhydantoinase A/oxoprolinase/acetone carboxylase beta subunit
MAHAATFGRVAKVMMMASDGGLLAKATLAVRSETPTVMSGSGGGLLPLIG